MREITFEHLQNNSFSQKGNWWDYKKRQLFWVNLASDIIRLNTTDRALDFNLESDMTITELIAMADSWLKINRMEYKR